MLTIETLQAFGADTQEGLARCCNSEALYLRLVRMLPADDNFDALHEAVQAGDLDSAFSAAHALKGILGNLSLTPMFALSSKITELLRVHEDADYPALVAELLSQRNALQALCAE